MGKEHIFQEKRHFFFILIRKGILKLLYRAGNSLNHCQEHVSRAQDGPLLEPSNIICPDEGGI